MDPTGGAEPASGRAATASADAHQAGVGTAQGATRADEVAETEEPRERTTRSSRVAWGILSVIIIGMTGLIVYALTRGTTPQAVTHPPVTSSDVLAALSSVPASAYDAVGADSAGPALTAPTMLTGQPQLESAGKPEVLFVGGEFCPFCAAERWPLVLALSRFGRFAVLHNVQSAADSAYSGIQSFSFLHDSYSSPYVTFVGVELYSSTVDAHGGYARIATPSSGEAALMSRYGTRPGTPASADIPFVDVANKMVTTTSGYSPAVIVGQSQTDVLTALGQPGTPVADAVLGSANELTAGICAATAGQPASVCSSKGVREADAALGLG